MAANPKEIGPVTLFSAPSATHSPPSPQNLIVTQNTPSLILDKNKRAKFKILLSDYNEQFKYLRLLDKETTDLLGVTCCTNEQNAQFWHYLIPKSCLSQSIYETVDIPTKNSWGGWYQSTFLLLFIRTLLETIERIKSKDDTLLKVNDNILALLERELSIAKKVYRSACDRDELEMAKQELENEKKKYEELTQEMAKLQIEIQTLKQCLARKNSDFLILYAELQVLSVIKDAEQKKMLEAIQFIEKTKQDLSHSPYITLTAVGQTLYQNAETQQEISGNLLQITQKAIQNKQSEETLTSIQVKEITTKITSLTIRLQTIGNDLTNKRKEIQQAKIQFEQIQSKQSKSLFIKIRGLKSIEHYCHAAGFEGNALYFYFQLVENKIQVTIINSGAPSPSYIYQQKSNSVATPANLQSPYILEFSKTAIDLKNLQKYCDNIIQAITASEKTAIELLYQSSLGTPVTRQQSNDPYPEKLNAETQQTHRNYMAMGYFQSIKERIGNVEIYKKLMFSLFIWSRNSHFLRNYASNLSNSLPCNIDELITNEELHFFGNSESAFQGEDLLTFRKYFSLNSSSKLIYSIVKPIDKSADLSSVKPESIFKPTSVITRTSWVLPTFTPLMTISSVPQNPNILTPIPTLPPSPLLFHQNLNATYYPCLNSNSIVAWSSQNQIQPMNNKL